MFAGAAREAVFSKREVAETIRENYIPVALKAALVNNPPPGIEGEIYREIGRSKAAAQGICVINSAGKVLAWTIGFDDDPSIGAFLDHCRERYSTFPDAENPITTERYRRFPSMKMPDVADTRRAIAIPVAHASDDHCPGDFRYPKGTFLGRVVGRLLNDDGTFDTTTRSQDSYVEDRFEIATSAQAQLAAAARSAGDSSFVVPRDFVRALVGNAHLGQLDVAPVGGPGKTTRADFALEALRVDSGSSDVLRLSVTGATTVAARDSDGGKRSGGRRWENQIDLKWRGIVDIRQNTITDIALIAEGKERLSWDHEGGWPDGAPEVTYLLSGHKIDLEGKVRYGITGRPVAASEVGSEPGAQRHAGLGDRAHLINLFGHRYRPFITGEFKATRRQHAEIDSLVGHETQSLVQQLQALSEISDRERPKLLRPYRDAAAKRLDAELARILGEAEFRSISGE